MKHPSRALVLIAIGLLALGIGLFLGSNGSHRQWMYAGLAFAGAAVSFGYAYVIHKNAKDHSSGP